jgi:hypothetical protein
MGRAKRKSQEPAPRASMTTKREIWLSVEEIERACREWVRTQYGAALPDTGAVKNAIVRFAIGTDDDGVEFDGAHVIIEDANIILAKEDPKPEPEKAP